METKKAFSDIALRTVTSEHGRISYYEAGNGPTCLVVTGWALSEGIYKRLVRELVNFGFHVLLPAQPGSKKTRPLTNVSLAKLAEWNWDFLDAVAKEKPVTIFGHSLGGAIGMHMAEQRSEQTHKLVLLNSIGAQIWREVNRTKVTTAQRSRVSWMYAFTAEVIQAEGFLLARYMWGDVIRNLSRRPFYWLQLSEAARKADLSATLASVKTNGVQVFAVWGERDRVVTPLAAAEITHALNAECLVLPGQHVTTLLRPKDLLKPIATPRPVSS